MSGMVTESPAGIERIIARIAPEWPDTIEVAAGWYPLLVELDAQLAALAPDYIIYQVKAKFGSLSFYAQPSDDVYDYNQVFQETIRAAEWKSIETCEECGQPARQYTIRMWTWTLCAAHAAEKSR